MKSIDDATRIAMPGTEAASFAAMVVSYWDQACALLNYGLLREDLFFETSGQFFGVWEQVKLVVPEFRERIKNKQLFAHLEKAAQRYESWAEQRNPGCIAAIRQFKKQAREQSGASPVA